MGVQIDVRHRDVDLGLVTIKSIGCDRNFGALASDKRIQSVALRLVDGFSSQPGKLCERGGITVS